MCQHLLYLFMVQWNHDVNNPLQQIGWLVGCCFFLKKCIKHLCPCTDWWAKQSDSYCSAICFLWSLPRDYFNSSVQNLKTWKPSCSWQLTTSANQPTTPFMDNFLGPAFFVSQSYEYGESCQESFPAQANHMLTGCQPAQVLKNFVRRT